jgi:hypothetical protein
VVSFVTIAILPAHCDRRNVAVRSGLPITVIKSLIKGKCHSLTLQSYCK